MTAETVKAADGKPISDEFAAIALATGSTVALVGQVT